MKGNDANEDASRSHFKSSSMNARHTEVCLYHAQPGRYSILLSQSGLPSFRCRACRSSPIRIPPPVYRRSPPVSRSFLLLLLPSSVLSLIGRPRYILGLRAGLPPEDRVFSHWEKQFLKTLRAFGLPVCTPSFFFHQECRHVRPLGEENCWAVLRRNWWANAVCSFERLMYIV